MADKPKVEDFATDTPAAPNAGLPTLDSLGAIDMAKVDTEFKALPEAIYDAHVEEITLEHKEGDPTKPYLKWVFRLDGEAGKNRQAWLNTSLQSQALFRVKQIFEKFGVDVSGSVNLAEAVRGVTGAKCKLWLAVKTWEGKERNEVADVLSAKGEPATF